MSRKACFAFFVFAGAFIVSLPWDGWVRRTFLRDLPGENVGKRENPRRIPQNTVPLRHFRDSKCGSGTTRQTACGRHYVNLRQQRKAPDNGAALPAMPVAMPRPIPVSPCDRPGSDYASALPSAARSVTVTSKGASVPRLTVSRRVSPALPQATSVCRLVSASARVMLVAEVCDG